jgi:hypothetical protein
MKPVAQSAHLLARKSCEGAFITVLLAGVPAWSQVPATDFPLVVFCEYKGIGHAYYLSQVNPDGVAVYMTPDRQVGTITAQGTAQRISDEQSGTCEGKTLSDLRAEGRAFDIAR